MNDQLLEGGFYFALPRFVNRMRGRSADVSENNAFEARLAGFGLLVLSVASAFQLFAAARHGWLAIPLFALAVLTGSIFWLLAFYLNYLAIEALRMCGLFRQTANRHAQGIFIAIIAAVLAYRLLIPDSWTRWIGIVCLLAIGLNLLTARMLKTSAKRH
jgi:hypothetical protein